MNDTPTLMMNYVGRGLLSDPYPGLKRVESDIILITVWKFWRFPDIWHLNLQCPCVFISVSMSIFMFDIQNGISDCSNIVLVQYWNWSCLVQHRNKRLFFNRIFSEPRSDFWFCWHILFHRCPLKKITSPSCLLLHDASIVHSGAPLGPTRGEKALRRKNLIAFSQWPDFHC
jgi:hypothetical protein